MANVGVQKNQFLMVETSESIQVTCNPIPMGDANYLEISTKIESLFNYGATAAKLSVSVEGGNDGQTFEPIPAIAADYTAVGTSNEGGTVHTAFVLIKYVLTSTAGNAGEFCAVTFDGYANLGRQIV